MDVRRQARRRRLQPETGWLDGASPTTGFRQYGATRPFGTFYADLTGGGGGWIDWIYMGSMLLIGLGLTLGIATRPAAVGGIVWMLLFCTASFAPENNPVIDQHIAHIALLLGVLTLRAQAAEATTGPSAAGPPLTPAELRLLPYLQTHLTFRQIGARLYVSQSTVATQAKSIYRKLGVGSRDTAITRATAIGLLGG